MRRYELYQRTDELDEAIEKSGMRASRVQHKLSDESLYLKVLQNDHANIINRF